MNYDHILEELGLFCCIYAFGVKLSKTNFSDFLFDISSQKGSTGTHFL